MVGGEPFVQKDTYKLLDEVSAVNTACEWSFVTNGQWVWSDYVQSRLDKINKIHINMSLDSVNPTTYALLRKKGRLQKSLENLRAWQTYQKFKNLDGEMTLQVSFLISKINWREIPEIKNFCTENNLNPFFQFLQHPLPLSIKALPDSEKFEAFDQIKNWVKTVPELDRINWHEASL
jgi:cyclic pyranopterin phosphate synthase